VLWSCKNSSRENQGVSQQLHFLKIFIATPKRCADSAQAIIFDDILTAA
jgi:hypothetical protein